MDAHNFTSYLGFLGYVVALLSAVFAYFNRDRYKTLVRDIYEPGNQELRAQIETIRSEKHEIANELTAVKVELASSKGFIKRLEEINSRLPDITTLTTAQNQVITLMSNNHTEVMKKMTELAKKINKR